ncbi:tyrosine-type recombinase/integrase [Thauera phenylacetica]
MDTPTRPVSPLRQRMLDDMRMRKLTPKTQSAYIRAVCRFTRYLGRAPDTATVEDLRNYQLHLVDTGTSPMSLNAAISGLKFFFDITLQRGELMARMQPVRLPQRLPVVLSREEVARLIAACNNLKHQTALSLAYATGLRASEVVSLKVSDVNSGRMTLRVEQGKGRKDRYAMLSPLLLERLRVWWRVARAQGKMLDGGWLFPGLNPIESLSPRQLNRAVQAAALAAGIDKRVSMHTLRHCFATHLLEQKVEHPHHPGAARPQETRHHGDLHPGRHRPAARSRQSAGDLAVGVGASWLAPHWRSRTSSAPSGRRGVSPSTAT